MLPGLTRIGFGKKNAVFLRRDLHLHAMPVSCGYSREKEPSYDWHGLKRGDVPLALFQYTLAGKGMLSYEGREYEVGPGAAMILHFPFNNRYWLPEGWPPWEFLYVCLNGSEAIRIWKEMERRKGPIACLDETSSCLQAAVGIYEKTMHGGFSNAYEASSLAYQFIMLLAREVLADQEEKERPAEIERAVAYCKKNFRDPVSVKQIAGVSGLSRYHFTRRFRTALGISPWQFLVNLRLEEAAKLLEESPLSVKEVAYACGFADENYFCKSFRKKLGISPTRFRKI